MEITLRLFLYYNSSVHIFAKFCLKTFKQNRFTQKVRFWNVPNKKITIFLILFVPYSLRKPFHEVLRHMYVPQQMNLINKQQNSLRNINRLFSCNCYYDRQNHDNKNSLSYGPPSLHFPGWVIEFEIIVHCIIKWIYSTRPSDYLFP